MRHAPAGDPKDRVGFLEGGSDHVVDGDVGQGGYVDSEPRFSVVIPAVNESLVIGACLRSLASQDFAGGYEVIVVDNNSTDDTAAIAQTLGAKVVREPLAGVCLPGSGGPRQLVASS